MRCSASHSRSRITLSISSRSVLRQSRRAANPTLLASLKRRSANVGCSALAALSLPLLAAVPIPPSARGLGPPGGRRTGSRRRHCCGCAMSEARQCEMGLMLGFVLVKLSRYERGHWSPSWLSHFCLQHTCFFGNSLARPEGATSQEETNMREQKHLSQNGHGSMQYRYCIDTVSILYRHNIHTVSILYRYSIDTVPRRGLRAYCAT